MEITDIYPMTLPQPQLTILGAYPELSCHITVGISRQESFAFIRCREAWNLGILEDQLGLLKTKIFSRIVPFLSQTLQPRILARLWILNWIQENFPVSFCWPVLHLRTPKNPFNKVQAWPSTSSSRASPLKLFSPTTGVPDSYPALPGRWNIESLTQG